MEWIPEDLYARILESVPIACVDVAIIFEGRILLVERMDEPAKGELWLPGGRVRKGERLRECAQRKAREEVGIDCFVGPVIFTDETLFDRGPHGIPVHSINSCFLLYPKSTDIDVSLDDHHARHVWVDTIDGSLSSYVRACLLAAGLQAGERGQANDYNVY